MQPNTGVFDRSDSDKAETIQVRFTLLRKQVTLCHTNWTAFKVYFFLIARYAGLAIILFFVFLIFMTNNQI